MGVSPALDDLQGHFPAGYSSDDGHPNNWGYDEFHAAIAPSLFKALEGGKIRPAKLPTSFVRLNANRTLEFAPEATVHPMTVLMDIQTSGQGNILQISTQSGIANLRINSAGQLEYVASNNATITSSSIVNNGAWHTIGVTHYFAQGVTQLYIDGARQGSSVNERIATQKLSVKGFASQDLDVRNLMFFRSAMNGREMSALYSGTLLQSSLELYAPLDGLGRDTKAATYNYAQSTNALRYFSTEDPVALYQNCNYDGYVISLTEGRYDLMQLNSLGILNDDISSLRVQQGYQITLYQNWDFTGRSLTKTAEDSCLVDDGFNDDISSVVISRTSASSTSGR